MRWGKERKKRELNQIRTGQKASITEKRKRERQYQKREAKESWHKIFVWFPTFYYDFDQWLWLEYIERRYIPGEFKNIERGGLFGGDISYNTSRWEYRLIDKGVRE